MPTRSQKDPTNQAGLRQRANRDNNRRINRAAKAVLKEWANIKPKRTSRKPIVNRDAIDFYVYDEDQEQIDNLFLFVFFALNEELETFEDEHQDDWYFLPYPERAANNGTMQENAWIEVLFQGLAFAPLLDENIFASDSYQAQVDRTAAANYQLIKSLSSTTAKQVNQVIIDGISAGLSKLTIRRQIIERFEVSKSSSKRIVDTEVNKAYNNARIDLVQRYRDAGENLALMHISALLPGRTRPNHAARHGKAYTPEQQKRWWDSGSNRINCFCSTRSIRVNRDGTVKDKDLQNRIRKQGKDFFK